MSKGNVLKQRTVTGLLFGLVILTFLLSGPLAIILLLVLVQILCFQEFIQCFFPGTIFFNRIFYTAISFTPYLILLFPGQELNSFLLSAVSVFYFALVLVMGFMLKWRSKSTLSLMILGTCIISLPVLSGIQLILLLLPREIIFLYLVLGIWAFDVFAYLTGTFLGRRLLARTISPKKTIEGSIGGLILTFVVYFIIYTFDPLFTLEEAIAMGTIVILLGQTGDLAQSILKRQAGLKDSGSLLPGHGGFWDRFDSLLAVLPGIFLYYAFTQFY